MIKKHSLHSKYLNREISYSVNYSENKSDVYFYFFDAQNLYDKNEAAYGHIWDINKVLNDLKLDVNVVALYSLGGFDRVAEYQPFEVENKDEKPIQFEAKGELTTECLVKEIMPLVENQPANIRLIGGSSMGGVMSLYIGQKYPELFSKVCAMSTAGYFAPKALGYACANYDAKNNQKVYLDCGTKESDEQTMNMTYLLLNRILAGVLGARVDSKYVEALNHLHNEDFWHKRLYGALEFLMEINNEMSNL